MLIVLFSRPFINAQDEGRKVADGTGSAGMGLIPRGGKI
jgi:hypothetical protein